MRVPSFAALSVLLIASSASAVTMAWTPIGNPGNACDPQSQGCFGVVGYAYQIGTYEVTNAQYAEFLNAKAAFDPLGLYNPLMGDAAILGGITRSGSDGSYTYSAIGGRANMPVNYVSFYDALRFANWMNNGQGFADTETGAYTLLGATPIPSNEPVMRNAGATIVLTSEDEWYKAAYYDGVMASYFDYPAGSDTQITCAAPNAAANQANCDSSGLTDVGSYPGSASPYGTFDQGGNIIEWNEALLAFGVRGVRGGVYNSGPFGLVASAQGTSPPGTETRQIGFRIAMIPEPGTGLLVIAGLLGLARWRRGAMSHRFTGAFAVAIALSSLMALLSAPRASALACVPGAKTVFPPCTFDGGLISLDSAPIFPGDIDTIGSFPTSSFGPGLEVAANIAGGFPPFTSVGHPNGTNSASITLTLSTVGGTYLIDALRFSLIDPAVTGTGTITWGFGSASDGYVLGLVDGLIQTTSGDLNLASTVSSVTETINGSLISGASGTATMTGFEVFVHLVPVPEPSTGLLVLTGLLGLAGRRWRAH
jgi:formylglycine-generating enzyme required for sulfatase activity